MVFWLVRPCTISPQTIMFQNSAPFWYGTLITGSGSGTMGTIAFSAGWPSQASIHEQ